MAKVTKALMREKDGIRGLVPRRQYGIQDTVFGEYLKKLDPRGDEHVQLALAASKDHRFTEFLNRVMSPTFKRVSLQTIAKACDISLLEFNQWWQQQSTQRAIAVAQTASIKITEDMVEDAATRIVGCGRCDGLTWIAAPAGLPKETPGYKSITVENEKRWIRDCPDCEDGTARKPGDPHARDKVLELSGLIQKGRSGITLVQNFGGAGHASAVSDLAAMDTPFYDVTPERS